MNEKVTKREAIEDHDEKPRERVQKNPPRCTNNNKILIIAHI